MPLSLSASASRYVKFPWYPGTMDDILDYPCHKVDTAAKVLAILITDIDTNVVGRMSELDLDRIVSG